MSQRRLRMYDGILKKKQFGKRLNERNRPRRATTLHRTHKHTNERQSLHGILRAGGRTKSNPARKVQVISREKPTWKAVYRASQLAKTEELEVANADDLELARFERMFASGGALVLIRYCTYVRRGAQKGVVLRQGKALWTHKYRPV